VIAAALACAPCAYADPADATSARAYGDVSAFYGSDGGSQTRPLVRGAIGVQLSLVTAGAASATRFRLGTTIAWTTLARSEGSVGSGAEASVDRMLSRSIRLGLRGGTEMQHSSGPLWTVGPRVTFASSFWIGADLFELELTHGYSTGVLVGLGLSP
jgi:hypothetical protein